ncbi:MAG: hypothetical protein KBC38_03215 [Candidatus Pacebacteria bacterium]|nr:hypothetical protein [Candidatus Paceibacterota bacterium]MBP9840579.1 hypothetical protein [Candidatus Paceibacterota bacterium]
MSVNLKILQGQDELIASESFLVIEDNPVDVKLSADDGPPLELRFLFDEKDEKKNDGAPVTEVKDEILTVQLGHVPDGGNAKPWAIGTNDKGDEEIVMLINVQRQDPSGSVRILMVTFYKRKRLSPLNA